ncbi:Mor transcription activator family protein [Vitreoscilla stercoraria]|uniref:Mor transcription activator domain-containing protein n=1 Tax=Vitreoscilla stercoraria TaxID=61 RepID=A0ABY4EE12_VITST|nr:Mor transcription activator family protein [Vitreoscilla stercoraria]UOO93599.1 hypothetical protein LVJ81_06130 [Vitreoscilla stercoraria]
MLEIEQDAFFGLSHLLPDSAKELILIIGWEHTHKLIEHYPGTHFPLGKNITKAGKMLHAALSEVIGEANTQKVEIAFAAQRKLWIPKCDKILLELRNRKIRQEFDELTRNNHMTAELAVRNLALSHKLVERTIWRIMKMPDMQFDTSECQQPLF